MSRTVLFVCPHGAAKSIMAAAYTAHLVQRYGLDMEVTTGGTEPDAAIAPSVAALLRSEGVALTNDLPHMLTQSDIDNAMQVISLGCPLDQFDLRRKTVEYWNDVPPPSKDVGTSRDAIFVHVEQLIVELRREDRV